VKFSVRDLLWLTLVLVLVCYNLIPQPRFKRGMVVRNRQTEQIGILIKPGEDGIYPFKDDWVVFVSGWWHGTDFRPGREKGFAKIQYQYWPEKSLEDMEYTVNL
jgi:hypothetical protein